MTGGGPPESAPPPDIQYERAHRRAALRSAGLSIVCIGVALVAIFSVAGRPGQVSHQVIPGSPGSDDSPATDGCTSRDLSKPALTAMPAPEVVTTPLTIRPGPDEELLSPPDSAPAVAAVRAWSLLRHNKGLAPSTDGSAQVLLGDLYASTPALVEPGRPAQPVFSHRLVWAIYGRHQPEPPAGGSEAAPCYFESTVFYVDAKTGRALVGEVFPPPAAAPAPAV